MITSMLEVEVNFKSNWVLHAGPIEREGDMSNQTFTVSEVSDIIGLPASTLRYYEKEGLIPPVERSEAGRRRYSLADLEALRFIECMKATGLPLTEIKEIIDLSQQGDSTIARRLEIMTAQRDAIHEQIARLDYHLEALDYKTWYYTTALEAGTCAVPDAMLAAGDVTKPDALRVNLG